jgi:hypothetical protein
MLLDFFILSVSICGGISLSLGYTLVAFGFYWLWFIIQSITFATNTRTLTRYSVTFYCLVCVFIAIITTSMIGDRAIAQSDIEILKLVQESDKDLFDLIGKLTGAVGKIADVLKPTSRP